MEIILAFILDLLIGDPQKFPHPIRWIGNVIIFLEKPYRQIFSHPRIGGICLTTTVVFVTYITTAGLLYAASLINPLAPIALGTIILFYSFSVRSLINASVAVLEKLEDRNITGARRALSMIVGRDTAKLNKEEIVRATVETVSENSVDGFISPLFYAVLGGPALAMTYKAVNTLDSMVGYKNEKYIDFGWASAKLDDIANYLPARISVFLIFLGTLLGSKKALQTLKIGFRDGRNHTSPNSGFSEAAFAGSLNIQLGGESRYGGTIVVKPTIGDNNEPLQPHHIRKANSLLVGVSVVAVICAELILFV